MQRLQRRPDFGAHLASAGAQAWNPTPHRSILWRRSFSIGRRAAWVEALLGLYLRSKGLLFKLLAQLAHAAVSLGRSFGAKYRDNLQDSNQWQPLADHCANLLLRLPLPLDFASIRSLLPLDCSTLSVPKTPPDQAVRGGGGQPGA